MKQVLCLVFVLALYVSCSHAIQSMAGLHVVGNKIYNIDNEVVHLRGVNRPGAEYSCVQYNKIFDGPSDQQSIDAMKSWKINSVRVPINEDCWLGTGGVNPNLGGSSYQTPVVNYINALTNSGLAVVVDLHWSSSSPGTNASHKQTPMPNRQQSPLLWSRVATAFKTNLAVIFDIFNEPFPDNNAWDSEVAWNCWKLGDGCPNMEYQAAGMQEIITAIRSTGATNIVMVGGIQYATSLVRWNQYKPEDPSNNLAAAVHVYDFNFCRSRGCWEIYWRPVMDKVPLIAGEAGESDCATQFIDDFMNYADNNGVHYLMWAWLPSNCGAGPSLINDFSGSPTNFGVGLKNHLDKLSNNDVGTFYYTFPVFTDARTHWVDNWSSKEAILFLNETSIVHSGQYSIRFQPTNNTALYFQCWGCIDTNLHKGIEFWVNGGSNSGQQLQLVLMHISDKSLIASGLARSEDGPIIDIGNMSSKGVVANEWVKVYLDLSTVPSGKYDGLLFRAPEPQNVLYLDDIYVYDKLDNAGGKATIGFSLVVVMSALVIFFGL